MSGNATIPPIPMDIRLNAHGSLDEIVCNPAYVHLEQMSAKTWWMAIEGHGKHVNVWFNSTRKIEVSIEETDSDGASANARLISAELLEAAPDLLDALKRLEIEAQCLCKQLAARGMPGVPGDTVDEAMLAAQAAIVKATTGDTP